LTTTTFGSSEIYFDPCSEFGRVQLYKLRSEMRAEGREALLARVGTRKIDRESL
jgi:hypothetical protein